MNKIAYFRNQDFFEQGIAGSVVFSVEETKEGIVVVENRPSDPGTVLEPYASHPDTWKKARFAQLGKQPDDTLISEAEQRFGEPLDNIRKTRRTIGTMTTLALVFDNAVGIVIVRRTSTAPEGTPYLGALSRFGGGATGGSHGKGIHGAQNLANQAVREFLQEFHPFVRPEKGVLVPLDIIPDGHEVSGLKGEFMRATMRDRLDLSQRIQTQLTEEGENIGAQRESQKAAFLSVSGLTKPLIQLIDGERVVHSDVVWCDNQPILGNMDVNLDYILAARLSGVSPEDIVFCDGEKNQQSDALLNRLIFLGDPDTLARAAQGEKVVLHSQFAESSPELTQSFRHILSNAPAIASQALKCV